MMRLRIAFPLLLFTLLTACHSNPYQKESMPKSGTEYAEKFSIQKYRDFSILEVYAPWQNASESLFRYIAAPADAVIPDSLVSLPRIITPVSRVIVMSTTFISLVDTLGEINTVKGISGGNFIYHKELRDRISEGLVKDVGFDQALNYELIVNLEPDLVFMFGVQSGIVQIKDKLTEIGIPVVLCADYLEPHPLGRAEWLKFFSVFYKKESLAEKIFKDIEERYNALLDSAAGMKEHPSVFLGLPWKDTWYIAGGNSFASRLIQDAGGRYIYTDLDTKEALPFDIEAVFSKALDADIWLNPGVAGDLNTILDHDARFVKLKSFQNGNVYNNNKRLGPGGGNDYWESGILHPDLILQDLINIFHGTKPDYKELHYYFRLERDADS